MPRVAVGIHLIEKDLNPPWPVPKHENVFDSGHWSNSVKTAQQLVGGTIFFHKHQSEPAHDGGIILSFSTTSDGLIIYRYIRAVDAVGRVTTAPEGWSREMKVNWVELEEET